MQVMLFGTFDGLHDGHRFVLQEAQKRGDVTVVVARDHNVERIKGRAPLQSETIRSSVIEKEFPNVRVVLGGEDDFLEVIRAHAPDLIVLGYDQKLPPSLTEDMLPCPTERLAAFHPDRFKSSLQRGSQNM